MISYFLQLLIYSFLLSSCSSHKPTPYQKEKKKYGYSDQSFSELRIARFRSNEHTDKNIAQFYAEFRAIEYCFERSEKHANILDIFDKTMRKEVIKSSGSGWGPSYGFGMYPYYSRYSTWGIGAQINTTSSDSWSEIIFYPSFEVVYNCSQHIFRPLIIFREINSNQMQNLVKDLKGAIQVEVIQDHSPNLKNLEVGDIILKANGKRIERIYELISLFNSKNSKVGIQLLREGKRFNTTLLSKDVTDDVKNKEKEIILKVCKKIRKNQKEPLIKSKICTIFLNN